MDNRLMHPANELATRRKREIALLSLLETVDLRVVLIIRLMVGGVFLSEGIQKFLFPAEVGAGRFARIGLPSPEMLGPFVGSVEIICGALLLPGLLTRLAVVPLLIIMAVAIWTTKAPILIKSGFWKMAHDSRNDYCMVMGALFLLVAGAGKWSLDWWLANRKAGSGSRARAVKEQDIEK